MEGERTAIMVTNNPKTAFLQAPEKKDFPAENVSVSQAWKRLNATDILRLNATSSGLHTNRNSG